MAALLFLSAGRADLVFFWSFLGVEAFGWVLMLANMDPRLFEERIRPAKSGVDRRLRRVMTALFGLVLVIVGLDAGRFGWSSVPDRLQWGAMGGLAAAFALIAWAQRVNSFFSPVVRIQSEREHRVITDGPYRYVRHPGYLGIAALMVFCPIALGSWWAMIPGVLAVGLLVRRAVIEDRFLHKHLDGYDDYARHVPYRVVPGLW